MQDGRVIGKVSGPRVVKVPPFNKEPMVERNPFVKEIKKVIVREGDKRFSKVVHRPTGVQWVEEKERRVVKFEGNGSTHYMVEVSKCEASAFRVVYADENGEEEVSVKRYLGGNVEVKGSDGAPSSSETFFVKVKPEETDKFSNKILLGAGFYPVASP